jgi:hypothetical protein
MQWSLIVQFWIRWKFIRSRKFKWHLWNKMTIRIDFEVTIWPWIRLHESTILLVEVRTKKGIETLKNRLQPSFRPKFIVLKGWQQVKTIICFKITWERCGEWFDTLIETLDFSRPERGFQWFQVAQSTWRCWSNLEMLLKWW